MANSSFLSCTLIRTLKLLTDEVTLIMAKLWCSSGKPWVLMFMWMFFDP